MKITYNYHPNANLTLDNDKRHIFLKIFKTVHVNESYINEIAYRKERDKYLKRLRTLKKVCKRQIKITLRP